ncbi:MAG: cupredoxin family protein [Hyphomicrobiales bacterium]|nr:cupredoxin family protein [Hyphomicrobiales bacterium]
MKNIVIAGIVLALFAGPALAHGENKHAKKKFVPANLDQVENEFGQTGDPNQVTRTINVTMSDEMKFEPSAVRIKAGETIRFLVKNPGEILHEMVLGRTEDLKKHALMMQKFPNMEHAEPYMAHANEGQTAEIVWTFSKPGTFEFGCLIPGHYESGMKGQVVVEAFSAAALDHRHLASADIAIHNASGNEIGTNR